MLNKVAHDSTCKLSTPTTLNFSPQVHVTALVKIEWRKVREQVFNTITVPVFTNPELSAKDLVMLTSVSILQQANYWCTHLQVIQASLCTIREAQIDKPSNCEKFNRNNNEQLWTMRLTMWLETTFGHKSLRNFSHEHMEPT